MPESDLRNCAEAIAKALGSKALVVVLTGAGVSSESGIPPYRGPGGLWRRRELRALAEARALRESPRLSWEFFQRLREILASARPNAAHYAIAEMDDLLRPQASVAVVTQNIDNLHQAAGSRHVVELHGSATRFHCTVCGCTHDYVPLRLAELPPRCACGGIIRPDIVLFGENLPATAWQEAQALIQRARVLVVVGTSLQVEPAASLPSVAVRRGAVVVEINLEPTHLTDAADFSFRGFAAEILPRLVSQLASRIGRRRRHAQVPRA